MTRRPEPFHHSATAATAVSLRVEPDGNGSASFTWEQVADTLADRLLQNVEDELGARAELLGLRFVDADGRNASGPVPGGVVLVGFVATDRADR